jgi:hypothetical protein
MVRNLTQFQHCESILNDLVGLCDRHSMVTPNNGLKTKSVASIHQNNKKSENNNEKLWFTVLDFILEQKHQSRSSSTDDHEDVCNESLRYVLADFVHVILTHMNGRVSLKSILKKITNDHKNQEFREFRSTITGMLENVRYEQKILQTAKQLLADAKYRQVYNLHRGHGQYVSNIDIKDYDIDLLTISRSNRSESTDGDTKQEELTPEEVEAKIKRKAGLRRVQRARRRDRKAHPAREEQSDDDEVDAEGRPAIKYSHHVLQLR